MFLLYMKKSKSQIWLFSFLVIIQYIWYCVIILTSCSSISSLFVNFSRSEKLTIFCDVKFFFNFSLDFKCTLCKLRMQVRFAFLVFIYSVNDFSYIYWSNTKCNLTSVFMKRYDRYSICCFWVHSLPCLYCIRCIGCNSLICCCKMVNELDFKKGYRCFFFS